MISDVISFINKYSSFFVSAHQGPEGDSISSTLAMGYFLKSIGKKVYMYCPDEMPDNFAFLHGFEEIKRNIEADDDFAAAIIVDCGDFYRIGDLAEDLKKKNVPICNIDHHKTNPNFGNVNYVNAKASSAGEMVYDIALEYGFKMDLNFAQMAYVAIVSDTGAFKYSNTSKKCLHISGDLIGLGVSPWEITMHLFENEPWNRIKLLKEVLNTIEISKSGKYASITITKEIFAKTGTSPVDTDRLINFARSIRGTEIACQFRETKEGFTKVSFRSRGKVDVSEICMSFGGGGHKNAAGCTIQLPIDEAKKTVFEKLDELLSL
ncbi:MAG: bifunctional oligoribonuclease/PAP phosphatase NrnA [Pseudomonadota bacterium]